MKKPIFDSYGLAGSFTREHLKKIGEIYGRPQYTKSYGTNPSYTKYTRSGNGYAFEVVSVKTHEGETFGISKVYCDQDGITIGDAIIPDDVIQMVIESDRYADPESDFYK